MSNEHYMSNDARLDFRLRHDIKAKIEQAAFLSGLSVSDFAVSTLLRMADDVLERQRKIHLSERDFDRFMALIQDDSEPNAVLQQATTRYKQRSA